MSEAMSDARLKAAQLALWSGPVEPQPLGGGITNLNFRVDDGGERFFVRIGDDIPLHGVMRFNERAASRAAAAAGISPAVVHAEPGVLVLRFIEGRTFAEADVRDPANLARIVDLVGRVHRDLAAHLRGPVLMFWVFQVIRGYVGTLRDAGAGEAGQLKRFLAVADALEAALGPVAIVFAHNDLLAANFIDDGTRLWLVDWDYAGFDTPLFDLANLASNNGLDAAGEDALLAAYFDRAPDDALRRRLCAMKAASLLRETLWSMVSEIHLAIPFDYAAYTAENLARFERALALFEETR